MLVIIFDKPLEDLYAFDRFISGSYRNFWYSQPGRRSNLHGRDRIGSFCKNRQTDQQRSGYKDIRDTTVRPRHKSPFT